MRLAAVGDWICWIFDTAQIKEPPESATNVTNSGGFQAMNCFLIIFLETARYIAWHRYRREQEAHCVSRVRKCFRLL